VCAHKGSLSGYRDWCTRKPLFCPLFYPLFYPLFCPKMWLSRQECGYGEVLVSRIDQIIGLFCTRALLKRRYSCTRKPLFCPKMWLSRQECGYGEALVSRIDQIIGLFCTRALSKRRYSAKETYNFIDPTDRSHPIPRQECGYQDILGQNTVF